MVKEGFVVDIHAASIFRTFCNTFKPTGKKKPIHEKKEQDSPKTFYIITDKTTTPNIAKSTVTCCLRQTIQYGVCQMSLAEQSSPGMDV